MSRSRRARAGGRRLVPVLATLLLGMVHCTRAPAPDAVGNTRFRLRAETGVDNVNQLAPTEEFNIVEYLYYYNGGGVAATDISGDGLPDLYFTNNQGPNKYYINEGNWRFRDATAEGGVAGAGSWSTGISVSDVNRDGRADLYVCNVSGYKGLTGRNELFLQAADGTFTEAAADYGLDFAGFSTQAYWFDYDLDGDLDLYLLRHSVHNDATYGRAENRAVPDSLAGDLLLRCDVTADGGVRYVDVTAELGLYSSKIGYGLSAAVGDFDGNGYPDLYVCNDFSENDYLYLNEGGRRFRESVRTAFGHTSNFSMGSDVGDLDRDGRPDLVTLDMRPGDESVLKSTASADPVNVYRIKRRVGYYHQAPRNNVQWNRGGGRFSEVGELAGLAATDWSWSVLLEDFDLDGYPEVFVANGIERRPNDLDYLKFISSSLAWEASNLFVVEQMPRGHVANQLFRRDSAWRYQEADWGLGYVGSSTGAATADLDGDGDADLVVSNVNAPALLYENTTLDRPGIAAGPLLLDSIPTVRYVQTDSLTGDTTLVALRIDDPAYASGRVAYRAHWRNGTVDHHYARPQRGMQSQSEVRLTVSAPGGVDFRELLALVRTDLRTGEPTELPLAPAGSPARFVAPEDTLVYTVETVASADPPTPPVYATDFDREPLLPYLRPAPAPVTGDFDGDGRVDTLDWAGLSTGGEAPDRAVWLPEVRQLIVGGDFQPLRYGVRTATGWRWREIAGTAGWWQSLSLIRGDDGREEVIAGNWGLNSTLGRPILAAPLRRYRTDVDGNGRVDPLITYERDGREYSLADKDELSAQFPSWRKNNLSYGDFSRRTFAENFPEIGVRPAVATTLAHQRLYRAADGEWRAEPLPVATQITPVNAAARTAAGLLLGGNVLEVLPRIGRQDAAALQLLRPGGQVELLDLGDPANRRAVRGIRDLGGGRWRVEFYAALPVVLEIKPVRN